MDRAVVCGAGGFIGGHVVKRLKRDGYWVRGVDVKHHDFAASAADEFLLLDLRDPTACREAVSLGGGDVRPDEVYQLAADMGGMGFISAAECDVLHNNALINVHLTHAAAAAGVPRYFFSSSVCVYRDMEPGEPPMTEDEAIPANPDNEYGWEKLYAERVALAYGRRHGVAVRIGRFQNCYGPEGTWRGGREKAPAAICRKVAETPDGSAIEVWGDGRAIRSYVYVTDLVDAVMRLMHSGLEGPTNIGSSEYVTVDELAQLAIAVSGKRLKVNHVDGPVGVQSRNFSHERISSLGWRPRVHLRQGIESTYQWIQEQVRNTQPIAGADHRMRVAP